MLYGVAPFDLPLVAGVIGLLAAVALAGAILPARTAVAIDPLVSLRAE
jgi:hypothetical protein